MHELFHHSQNCIHVLTSNNQALGISMISTIITFFAVFVALFKDWIISRVLKPKLEFKTAPSIPQIFDGENYRMYRLLVINNGGATARNVHALISNVTQPLNLWWTHIDGIARDISKGEPAYLDIVQEKGGSFYFYPWKDIINLPEYNLSGSNPTEIKIDFFEKDCVLQSVTLKLNPATKTLEVL